MYMTHTHRNTHVNVPLNPITITIPRCRSILLLPFMTQKKKKYILFAIDIKGRRCCLCVRVYCSCYHCCFVHSLPFVVKYLIFINKLKNKITHHLLYHLLSAADWPFSRTGLRMVNRMCIGFLAFISHSLS